MSDVIAEAKLIYKKYGRASYSNHSFTYDFCAVDYIFHSNNSDLEMIVCLKSALYKEQAWAVFVELLDFLYLAFGTMPIITYYKENGIEKDLSGILSRYFPSEQFFKNFHLIDISKITLNEITLAKLKNAIRNKPFEIFWAFTALTSKAYEHIYAEHKITLLLQCFEGYVYNENISLTGKDFKSRIAQVVNVLFDYDKRYNAEVLSTLSVSEEEYLNILKDTRHQFSHYISKQNSLSQGQDYTINFVLLHYIFRIYLLKNIGIQPNEDNIAEFLKSVYDWINVLKDSKFKNYKSSSYCAELILDQLKGDELSNPNY